MAALAIEPGRKYTYVDYLTWDEDSQFEIIDGTAVMMGAPTVRHQMISGNLYRAMVNHLAENQASADSNNVVHPDLILTCDQSKVNLDGGHQGPPELVAEILSPFTATYDLNWKYTLYRRSGVREYWVVMPGEKAILRFDFGTATEELQVGDLISPLSMSDLKIEIESIFPQG